MRICLFLSDITKIGGIERVVSTLANKLASYPDIQVEIVSVFKGREKANYNISDTVIQRFITTDKHGNKPHSLKRIIALAGTISKIRKFFSVNEYDFVLSQSFPPSVLMWLSGFPHNKILAVEHVYANYYNVPTRHIRNLIYNSLRKVVVLTSKDKQYFDRHLSPGRTITIPNPTHIGNSSAASLKSKRIISVGRLEYQKGYDNLVKVFAKVHERHPAWTLDIFGDGSLKSNINQQIIDAGLEHHMKLRGLTDTIDTEFQNSSIYVMSSRFEGFGMVLIEAMNKGVPCISFDCPNGPSDIIENGKNGLLVENQNNEELANAICRLIEDENLRMRLGKNAPQSVARFSENTIAQNWVDLLKSLSSE